MAWSPDGAWLASASYDASIRIWSLERLASSPSATQISASSASIAEIPAAHAKSINSLSWCPWQPRLLLSASSDMTASLWSLTQPAEPIKLCTITLNSEILTAAWHPRKSFLFFGTKSDEIFIYRFDATSSQCTAVQALQFRYAVNEVACNEQFLAVALGDGNVVLFEEDSAGSWHKTETLRIHTADCFCVRFSADGELLCTGGADAQVTVWSTAERPFVPLRCLNRMEWPIRTIAFNHDARFLTVGTEDPFVALEDWQSGQLVAKCVTGRAGQRGVAINCVAWHPSKNIFAFAGEEVNERTGRFTGSIRLIGLC